jgi:hypothetical protein
VLPVLGGEIGELIVDVVRDTARHPPRTSGQTDGDGNPSGKEPGSLRNVLISGRREDGGADQERTFPLSLALFSRGLRVPTSTLRLPG